MGKFKNEKIKYEDLMIEVFRAEESILEGSRGVRITHKPTGLSVTKTEKTLRENETEALNELLGILEIR